MLSPAVSMTALSSVCSRRALWIFEMSMGVPLRQHFNSSFRNSFGSYAGLNGPTLILRTAPMIHSHGYSWDLLCHTNGTMEGKMYGTVLFMPLSTPQEGWCTEVTCTPTYLETSTPT